MENNKELQDILKNIMSARIDMSSIASGGSMDIASILAPLTNIIGDIESNMEKYPKDIQEQFKKIIKEAKENTKEENIFKSALGKDAV